MNIVILGAGSLGAYLASVLSAEEHNVVLIDKDLKIIDRLSKELDVATIHGYGSNWRLLDDLLENKPDYFIAMTGDDESNLVACSMAKNLGYPNTICRIKDIGYLLRDRLDFGRLFSVDYFIAPEILAANDIFKLLLTPKGENIENFAHGTIQMHTIKLSDNWGKVNVPIHSLGLAEEMIIGAVKREDKEGSTIIFPHGDDYLLPKDEITIFGDTNTMKDVPEYFGLPPVYLHSVVIAGGSTIAFHLAKILEAQNVAVKMIEKNEHKCKRLADHLTKSLILNHDASEFSFLLSENVQECDVFISCTKADESNIYLASLGKQAGCKKVISTISNNHLKNTLEKIDIIPSISEKLNIANRILSLIHKEKIISVKSLFNDEARVIEMKISEHSKHIGIPLKDLAGKIPKDLIIALIENKGKVMIGKGNRIISPNDTVIIVSSPKNIQELQNIF
jgi:trk/ktr system potassium uptake protein